MCMNVYVYVCLCLRLCLRLCVSTFISISIYLYLYLSASTSLSTSIQIHAHTHTHSYTCSYTIIRRQKLVYDKSRQQESRDRVCTCFPLCHSQQAMLDREMGCESDTRCLAGKVSHQRTPRIGNRILREPQGSTVSTQMCSDLHGLCEA